MRTPMLSPAPPASTPETITAEDTHEADLLFRETGDVEPQLRINHETGRLEWSNGTDPPDANLFRTTAGRLQTEGDFVALGELIAGGGSGHPPGSVLRLAPSGANIRGIGIRLAPSQVANAFEVQNSAGTVLARVESGGIVRGTRVGAGSGGLAAPGFNFVEDGDGDTGIYRIGADNIGAAAGGSKILDLHNDAGTLKIGFLGVPAVERQALPAAGVVTADDIRTALINLGLAI